MSAAPHPTSCTHPGTCSQTRELAVSSELWGGKGGSNLALTSTACCPCPPHWDILGHAIDYGMVGRTRFRRGHVDAQHIRKPEQLENSDQKRPRPCVTPRPSRGPSRLRREQIPTLAFCTETFIHDKRRWNSESCLCIFSACSLQQQGGSLLLRHGACLLQSSQPGHVSQQPLAAYSHGTRNAGISTRRHLKAATPLYVRPRRRRCGSVPRRSHKQC